jgi:hypothetical protein
VTAVPKPPRDPRPDDGAPYERYAREAAGQISSLVGGVFGSIDRIRGAVLELVGSPPSPEHPARGDLERLRPLLEELLRGHGKLLLGCGFVADPSLLVDAKRWLEWWRWDPDGSISRLEVKLEGELLVTYDYGAAEWFTSPQHGQERSIVGPYVDVGGMNAYVLTLTVPVRSHGQFRGVAGADLSADRVEAVVRRMTRTIGVEAIVVNAEGRILASSVPRQYPGTLLRGLDLGGRNGSLVAEGRRGYHCPGLPWRLVVSTAGLE